MAHLTAVERNYFVRKLGGAANTDPLNNIKRKYFYSYIGSDVGPTTPLHQLEKMWLAKLINTAGVGSINIKNESDLWKNAVLAIGQTPSPYINNNKMKFFINAS